MEVSKTSLRRKICGMRDRDNILSISSLQPDYMGFIFYRNSIRFVGDQFEIPEELSKKIERVGVFVNQSTQEIMKLSRLHQLDMIQLHGIESPAQCKELRLEGVLVMKALAVEERKDVEHAASYGQYVDYILFDSKGKGFGGNGVPFDWTLLNFFDRSVPFFLGGGISSGNVQNLLPLDKTRLYAIDLNSGIEREPGVKDYQKTREIFGIVDSQNQIMEYEI